MVRKSISVSKFVTFVLLLTLIPLSEDSRAAITVNGSVSPGNVSSDPWYVDTLIVGNEGDGSVSILDGSNVLVDNDVFLAFIEDVLGIVIVDGGNSQLATGSGDIVTGARGEGRFTASGGATVWADETVVGGINPNYETLSEYFGPSADLGGGTGTVTVTDEASNWNSNSMMVGFSGDGTLEITGGGRVSNHSGMIGVTTDAVGTATVSGPDSIWTNNINLVVVFKPG
jgi:T5SS/PEP-CTERM-associated repeat protein